MENSSLLARSDSLEPFQIPSLPGFYYISDFLTLEEENSILQKVNTTTSLLDKWRCSFFCSRSLSTVGQEIPAQRWVTLSHRRLQAHPSTLTKNNTLLAAPLPHYLEKPIIDKFKPLDIFNETPHKGPNHVLVNEYKRGDGIMPHEDGAAYAPIVATVSLGASICLDITKKSWPEEDTSKAAPQISAPASEFKVPARILQEPRSLLVTTGAAYSDLLHGIAPIETDENLNAETVANWNLLANPQTFEEAGGRNERATRISLTYRDVRKTSSAANKILGGFGKR